MAPVKRTFEQADQGWTNEQALASDLGYAVGDEQFPSSASDPHSSSLQNSPDEYSPEHVAVKQAAKQAIQSEPPAKRPRKARRKKSDPAPDYSAQIQRQMTGLRRSAQACDRCKCRKMTCIPGYPACGNCAKEGSQCITTDRVTRRPIERGYLERVEKYAYRIYREAQRLQNLLAATWAVACTVQTHDRQLSNIITQAGLSHPHLRFPEHLSNVIRAMNDGTAVEPLQPPPTPPANGPTSTLLAPGNVPPNAQVADAGPPPVVTQPFQPQYPATTGQVQGAGAQSTWRAVKRRLDPRRNHTQQPNAARPATGAPARAPPVPGVNVNPVYPNVQLQPVPRPQNPRTRQPATHQPAIHQPTVQRSVPGTTANHAVGHAYAPHDAAGIDPPMATNRPVQRPSQSTHTEPVGHTGDEVDYLPQGLGDGYPAPPGQYTHGNHEHQRSNLTNLHSDIQRQTEQVPGNLAITHSTDLQDLDGFQISSGQSGHLPPAAQPPIAQNLAADVHQGPSGQSNFSLPPQHGDDTIDPSVLMPPWLAYGLDDLDTGVQAGTDETAPFVGSEQPHAPQDSDTGAQRSAAQPAPAAEAGTADNGENPGEAQPSGKVPSSSPVDFSVLDNVNIDGFPVPLEPFDSELGADIDAALAQFLGVDANPVQSPQPPAPVPTSVPTSVPASVPPSAPPSVPAVPAVPAPDSIDAELAQFLAEDPAFVDPQAIFDHGTGSPTAGSAHIPASTSPDNIDAELAQFIAKDPNVVEPQALFDIGTGSPTAGSAHADELDSLFEGSLGVSPSSVGGEAAPANEPPAGLGNAYDLGNFSFAS